MRPERARTARAPRLRGFGVSGPTASEAACSRHKGRHDGREGLFWFASRFRTVSAWRDAMLAPRLHHARCSSATALTGGHDAPQADVSRVRSALLWVRRRSPSSGRSSPAAIPRPPCCQGRRRCRRPSRALPDRRVAAGDVLALVPPTEDIVRLESLSGALLPETSPLMKLALVAPLRRPRPAHPRGPSRFRRQRAGGHVKSADPPDSA